MKEQNDFQKTLFTDLTNLVKNSSGEFLTKDYNIEGHPNLIYRVFTYMIPRFSDFKNPNKYKIAGRKRIISKGTVAIKKLLSVCILEPTKRPHIENKTDERAAPIKIIGTFFIPANKHIIRLTTVPTTISGIIFANMYSDIFIGETQSEDSTR